MTTVLVQSLDKMHMNYVFHNKFRMIIFLDQKTLLLNFKSSHSQMFLKIGLLKNVAIITKTPALELLFNELADLEACSCIKKRLQH